MKVQPLEDRILVQRFPAEEETEGGIVVPNPKKKYADKARVIAIGTLKKDKKGNPTPFLLKPGDMVYMPKDFGTDITHGGKKYQSVHEDEILAIIESEDV